MQAASLHVSDSKSEVAGTVEQSVSHILFRVRTPSPQVTEQSDHCVQSDKPQILLNKFKFLTAASN